MNPTYRRNRTGVVLLFAVALSLGPFHSSGWSYEVETHADISREGYILANIDGFLSEQLGLSEEKKLPRGPFLLQRPRTPSVWLQEGSRHEDEPIRFFNHFYDPIYNRGLTAGIQLGKRSHEWGLEVPEGVPGQEFSYRDARRYFRLSLTEPDSKDRERWLAETFYTLGHVIHLIQDLASPAHTRNALHVGWAGPLYLGPLSVVEKYLDLKDVRPGLKFDGYPIPREGFTQPRDFWVETDASGFPLNGPLAHGLSQIINRNFVSEGTNFTGFENRNHAEQYASPTLNTNDCSDEQVNTQDANGEPISGAVTFCRNSFTDPNTGVLETNPRMTTFSLVGRDLRERGLSIPGGVFSLNALNAVSIGQLTIPRAVGYSAGLLDYFFRGKLEVTRAPHPETQQPSLRIVNRATETLGDGGEFTLYQDDPQGTRTPVPGAGLFVVGPVPPDNDAAPLYLPIPAELSTEGLTLVYQGPLGAEAGAIIGKRILPIRLEEVYQEWTTDEWILRTTDGLYVLPLEAVAGLSAPLEKVTWGDRDNQLVGLTAPDSPDGYQALLFELDRPLGSAQVPTTGTVSQAGYPAVALRVVQQVPLYTVLGAMDLNTTVDVVGHLEFTQYMVSYTVRTICKDMDPDPVMDTYECTTTIAGDAVSQVKTWNDTTTAQFPLQLLPAHHRGSSWDIPKFRWSLAAVRADRTGHLVAVVNIATTWLPPEEGTRIVPLLEVNRAGGLVESPYHMTLGWGMQTSPLWIAAVLDLTAGRLVAKSCADQIHFEATERAVAPDSAPLLIATQYILEYQGGTRHVDPEVAWVTTWAGGAPLSGTPARTGVTLSDRAETRVDRLEGLYRASLASVGLGTLEPTVSPGSYITRLLYRVEPDGTAVVLELPKASPLPEAGASAWLRWTGPAPGALDFEVHALNVHAEPWATRNWLVAWDLATDTATLVHAATTPYAFDTFLANARGVVIVPWFDHYWLWVPWAGPPVVLPEMDAFPYWEYVAIDPAYLYHFYTGRFHAPRPGLPVDGAPAPLVTLPGGAWEDGAYHVVGR